MDIHRCRFVNYPSSTINVIAFSHTHDTREKKARHLRLAIGRANGDIEIWNPLCGAWVQETIIRGGKDRSVDGLVWIQDPEEDDTTGKPLPGRLRLFSIGYTTTITEWDLEKGQPLRQASGNHGEIWCLAAQPSDFQVIAKPNGTPATARGEGQNLITGCTDGAVVLYSTEGEDLRLESILVRPSTRRAKVISIVFRDRNIVVAGCTDSTIRIYDIRTRAIVRSMTLGTDSTGSSKEIIVWAVRCLPNGNIISGDSTGELRVWDGITFTLVQRILSHKQDILSLGISIDGSIILSGGMDRRTVIYKQTGGSKARWAEVSHRRFHGHDVKTMAIFEGKGMSVVVSGGPDASPIVVPLREFGMENQRMLPCLPQIPMVQSASKARLLLSWWDREVSIWNIDITPKTQHGKFDPDSNRSRKLVARIMIKGEANITSASITTDGTLLAVSTCAEIKLFHIKNLASRYESKLWISKLDISKKLSSKGGRLLQFSPDGKWLCVVRRDNNQVVLARVYQCSSSLRISSTLSNLERLDRKIEKRQFLGGLGAYERLISRSAFSSDSRILAVSDLAGYIDTWVLEGQEDSSEAADDYFAGNEASLSSSSYDSDSDYKEYKKPTVIYGQHWMCNPLAASIPKLPSMAVVLSFRPSLNTNAKARLQLAVKTTQHDFRPHLKGVLNSEDRLLVVSTGGRVFEFAVLNGALSAWSRRNPAASFPDEFKKLQDQAMGCLWNLRDSKERLWLYGSSWMWMFDLSRDLPAKLTLPKYLTDQNNDSITHSQHSQNFRKRKMHKSLYSRKDEFRNRTSGAGGRVLDKNLDTGMSRKHQRIVYEGNVGVTSILDHQQSFLSKQIDEVDEQTGIDEEGLLLERVQQGENATVAKENGSKQSNEEDGGEARQSPSYWHTYKYRPIMGIVPIDGETGLEVALVERPSWDMDLPSRYYGDQDWETPRP